MKKVITLLCSCILAASCSNPKQPVLDYKSQYAPVRIRTISESDFRKLIENGCDIRSLKNGVTTPVALCGNDNIEIFYENIAKVRASAKPESDVALVYGYAKMDKQQFMLVMSSYGFKDIPRKALFRFKEFEDGMIEPYIYSDYYKRIYNPYYHGEFPADVKQMLHKMQYGSSEEQYNNACYLQNDGFILLAKSQYHGNNNYSWFHEARCDFEPSGRTYPYVVMISSNEKFSDNFAAKIELKNPKQFWTKLTGYLMERNVSKKRMSWDPPYDIFFTQRQIDELNRTRR